MEKIKQVLNFLEKNDLYPDLRIIQGGATPEIKIDNRKVYMFSSNNYLGLATHPKVIKAAIEGIKNFGVGSGGSRLLSGNLEIHRNFEKAIAKFKGGEDAIAWPCGYSANVGVITALMNIPQIGPFKFNEKNIIISDELNHASIIDGARMSKQKVVIYKHCDMQDLEKKLKKYKRKRKLVVTDGVFSMDGDIAPLNEMSFLCKKYNAMLMTDEAHATGTLGKNGHGTLEHFNLKPITDVDIILGTCSKALASSGGFVVGSKKLIKYLRIASRSYIFSTATNPSASASLIECLKIIEKEPELKNKMQNNANYVRTNFQKMGYSTITSKTQIIPILIGEDEKAIKFTRKLFKMGIFGPCVRWPAVEKKKSRIRFTIMSTHTKKQLDYLLECCKKIGKELAII
jgi:8-amino-7-oxononanoate synthase